MKIAVVSGKGGAGKSSVAAAFASLSERLVAVDCDVDASNLPLVFPHEVIASENFVSGRFAQADPLKCTGCGICTGECVYGALSLIPSAWSGADVCQVNSFLCEGCGLCAHLCPESAITIHEENRSRIFTSTFRTGTGKAGDTVPSVLVHGCLYPGDDNSGKMIARLREIADRAMVRENIAIQLLDGPPGIGCPVISTVTGIDRIVIVCEPTLSGISDLERIWSVCGAFCKDMMVIINKADINWMNCLSIRNFCSDRSIPIAAELPFGREVVEAQVRCMSVVAYAPESACARALEQAWVKVSK